MKSKRLLFTALLVGGLLLLPSYLAQAQAFAINRPGAPQLPSSTNPGRKAPLREVLNGFKSKYGVDILFEDRLVANQEVLSGTVEAGASLEKNLGNVLKSRGLRFKKIKSGVYAILSEQKLKKPGPDETSRATAAEPLPAPAIALPSTETLTSAKLREVEISGRVTDEAGACLPAVSVAVKGTSRGTTTDAEGRYRLAVPDGNAVLVFSSVGYEKLEVQSGNRTVVDVVLKTDVKSLDEVVVVGYGTVKKSDLTGSVASISASELKKTQLTSFDQGLQGRAPGVQVTQSTGQPGGGVSIRVRGGNSITGTNEPLYVIDGFPVFNDPGQTPGVTLGAKTNPLSSINPNDIASIEVLKDASATAIYGSRGANGVVIITTKRGQTGKAKIDYEGYVASQQVVRMIPMLNARQYAELINEARQNAGIAPFFSQRSLDSLSTAGTDWQRELFRSAPMHSHQLTISGGNEQVQYAISGNHLRQEGIIINSGFKRSSLRLNLDANASKLLKVGGSLLFSQTNSRIVPTEGVGTGNPGVIWSAQMYSPLLSVYNPDGSYTYRNIEPPIGNPVAYANGLDDKSLTSRLLSSLYAEFRLMEGLTFKVNGGIDYSNTKESLYIPATIFLGEATKGQGTVGTLQLQSLLLENTLNYQRIFNNKHSVNALVGYTIQNSSQDLVRAASQNYPTDQLGYNDLSFGTTYLAPASGVRSSKLASYLGRVNYSLNGRYLVTGTIRVDGSTRFGAGNKYGVFPSGSVAWRLIEEPFMQAVENRVSDLKLRLSYGLTGNQEIGLYQSLPLLSNFATVFGNNLAMGIAPSNIANPDLKWETTAQFDVGVDLALWNNRVTLTADYYRKKTRDLLLNITLPLTSGYASTLKNIGQVSNTGWELGVSTINVDKQVRWTTSFNLSGNRNKVLSLGDITQFLSGSGMLQLTNFNIVRVGEPVGSFFGQVNDGIFQSQAEVDASAQKSARPGDRRYKDLNNDGVINGNDRAIIGNAQPKLFGGMTNTLSYKGFELSAFLNFVTGNRILNVNRFRLETLGSGSGAGAFPGTSNNSLNVLDRWTPTNPSQTVARANTVYPGDVLSSYQIEDGSFLRLRNVLLAYNLPTSVAQRIGARLLRVYVSGQNLLTLTKYTGYDPEVSRFGQSALNAGIDFGGYPLAKLYTLGLNLGF
jgi:TonB-linked SusC/RagA family outer membrane protein